MDFTENCKSSLIKVLFCFCFFYSEVHYFLFYFLCQKLSVWSCSRNTPAAETPLAWIISSSSSAYKPHFHFASCLAGLNLPCCWNLLLFVCVGCGSIQSLILLLQLLFWGVLLLHVCLPTTKEEKHTKNQCATVNSQTRFPLWNFDTFNLNHTWTHSNHRDTTPFDFKCSLCF